MRHAAIRLLTAAAVLPGAVLPGVVAADMMTAADRARAGSFDATGEVACAPRAGQAMQTCAAAVARDGDAAAVVVTFPTGFARMLLFEDGGFVRGNPTMSGTGTDTDWHLTGETHVVRVDDQRFELPGALVFGNQAAPQP